MSSISPTVAGSNHTPYSVTWVQKDADAPDSDPGTPLDLTGATLTLRINQDGAASRAGAGQFQIVDAVNGKFVYTPDPSDLVAGRFHIQFVATYPDSTEEICDADAQIVNPAL